jgi:hypothetical protein
MGKNRVEAFSDGVIAIIITIMVLELKVPHGEKIKSLVPLIPVIKLRIPDPNDPANQYLPGGTTMKKSVLPIQLAGLLTFLLFAVFAGPAAAQGNKTYTLDMTKCAGFTAADAAKVLGLPASKLTAKTEKIAPNLWRCSFITSDGKGLSYSVTIAPDVKNAAAEMEQLRSNLEVAAETAPFKNKLPKGAYSEISGPGLGDETVWTDVNGTFTVRKGNVILQVLMPAGKVEQVKAAQAFLATF